MASGFPVLVLREDLDGEDGILTDGGLEEGEELFGYGALGNVGDSHGCCDSLLHGHEQKPRTEIEVVGGGFYGF